MTVEHREVLELLPWYINGTLVGSERAKVERHINDCLPCNAALKEERRLRMLVQNQESVPIGPEHGIGDLLRRVDRGDTRRGLSLNLPVLGYSLAAALGGAVVWAYFALDSEPANNVGEFSTLSSVAESEMTRIDVVFIEEPSPDELNGLVDEFGGMLVSGPSELGRYTIALEARSESMLNEILTTLRSDPNIRFAGRSFVDDSNEAGEAR
jgi:hypothetical protein